MSSASFDANLVLETVATVTQEFQPRPTETDATLGPRIIPTPLRQWLARLRLLENVPFAYVVPDSLMLPPESIRFFHNDRAWTDALVQGALSVGTVNSSDRAQLERLHRQIRDELDEEERLVRQPTGAIVQKGPARVMTGVVLRSRAVSGWPGLHVRAYRNDTVADDAVVPESDPNRLKILRLERLAPAVLFALFDGVPAVVHIEEPRQGIQFGVRLETVGTNQFSAFVFARDRNTSADADPPREMAVSFRTGSPGVIDFRRTAETFRETPETNMGTTMESAEYALQMIRFPYRQVFGDPATVPPPIDVVFRASVSLTTLHDRFSEVLG
jgi:hypothetical protein